MAIIGEAKSSVIVTVAVVAILLPAVASAVQYTVGDGEGWNFGINYSGWAAGKKFRVGDTLLFNYQQEIHNVVIVDEEGYENCAASPNHGILRSGNDGVALTSTGKQYFICGVPGHCEADQKLTIEVLE